MSARLLSQSISEQTHAVESAAGTAAALVQQTREQIERCEPDLRAWVTLSPDIAAQAATVEHTTQRLPLRGVSLGVKDLIDVAGLPTRAGSSITPTDAAPADADCVARLRALGAVVQGKTVTTEFGYFAPGPDWQPTRLRPHSRWIIKRFGRRGRSGHHSPGPGYPNRRLVDAPASYCGAAGIVLAHGSTSMSGIVGLSDSLDSLGMLTRTVDDLRLVYRALQGPDTAVSRLARNQHRIRLAGKRARRCDGIHASAPAATPATDQQSGH